MKVYETAKIIGREHIRFGTPVIVDDFVLIYAKASVVLGNYVHIAAFSSLVAAAPIEIGDFAAVSHGCRVLTATDDFKHGGFGNSTVPLEFRNLTVAPIRIGRFCVIGANSVVLPGVEIGEGATVGACSVVTRDLAPWGVYIGNRRIGERNRSKVMENFARFEGAERAS
jgi:acetyltransferase-like isoleucine patch superfamily enzyme